jgi:hypothetical protein
MNALDLRQLILEAISDALLESSFWGIEFPDWESPLDTFFAILMEREGDLGDQFRSHVREVLDLPEVPSRKFSSIPYMKGFFTPEMRTLLFHEVFGPELDIFGRAQVSPEGVERFLQDGHGEVSVYRLLCVFHGAALISPKEQREAIFPHMVSHAAGMISRSILDTAFFEFTQILFTLTFRFGGEVFSAEDLYQARTDCGFFIPPGEVKDLEKKLVEHGVVYSLGDGKYSLPLFWTLAFGVNQGVMRPWEEPKVILSTKPRATS